MPPLSDRSMSSKRAMTLVEVILAMSLLSTMMGAVGSLLQSGLRSQVVWGQTVEPHARLERALMQLERDIEAAQPFFGIPAIGSGEQLEAALFTSEWMRIVYRLQSGALMREAYAWKSGAASEPKESRVLIGVTEIQWAYGRLDPQGQLIWVDSWDGAKDGVPKLLKLAITAEAAPQPVALTRIFRNPAGNLPQDQPN